MKRMTLLKLGALCMLCGVVALSFVGCATSSEDLLPPRFEAALDTKGRPIEVTYDQLNALAQDLLRLRPTMEDTAYHVPTHEWMERFASYLSDRRQGLAWHGRLVYQADWPDCDDFAKLAVAAALLANDGRWSHPPLIGTVTLSGAPNMRGLHAMVWYVTDRGLYLYEPQSGEDWLLATYSEITSSEGTAAIAERLRQYAIVGVSVALLAEPGCAGSWTGGPTSPLQGGPV